MGSLRLLEDQLDSLESLLLILELSANDIVVDLSVLAGLVAEVVQHLLWGEIIPVDLLDVHESLSHREQLMLTHLDHLTQLPLLLIESCIVLLLLPQL